MTLKIGDIIIRDNKYVSKVIKNLVANRQRDYYPCSKIQTNGIADNGTFIYTEQLKSGACRVINKEDSDNIIFNLEKSCKELRKLIAEKVCKVTEDKDSAEIIDIMRDVRASVIELKNKEEDIDRLKKVFLHAFAKTFNVRAETSHSSTYEIRAHSQEEATMLFLTSADPEKEFPNTPDPRNSYFVHSVMEKK